MLLLKVASKNYVQHNQNSYWDSTIRRHSYRIAEDIQQTSDILFDVTPVYQLTMFMTSNQVVSSASI